MSDVMFRRIGGRVVPIRLNNSKSNKAKSDKSTAKAVAAIGGGAGIGAATVGLANAAVKKAVRYEGHQTKATSAAFRVINSIELKQLDLFKSSSNMSKSRKAERYFKQADKAGAAANAAYRAAGTTRKVGAAAAGTLVGVGTNTLLKNHTALSEEKRGAISTGIGSSAAFTIHQAHFASFSPTPIRSFGKALAKIAKKYVKMKARV